MKRQKRIKLASIMDVKEFVYAASKCNFDVNVCYNQITVDAKSVLGVLSLDLSKILTVEYEGEDPVLENMLDTWNAEKENAMV